jgi:preprotein translocase SecE subunit
MKKVTVKKTKNISSAARKPSFSTNPKQELKKVTWPNQDTLLKSTILIIVIIIVLTIYVTGLDVLLSKLFYFLRELL